MSNDGNAKCSFRNHSLHTLKETEYAKYLVIHISNKLNWKQHINKIILLLPQEQPEETTYSATCKGVNSVCLTRNQVLCQHLRGGVKYGAAYTIEMLQQTVTTFLCTVSCVLVSYLPYEAVQELRPPIYLSKIS